MKKLVFLFLSLLAAGGIFQACDDSKTYAEMLEDEKNAVNKFIKDKGIRIISQDEFEKNDTVTNLERNEYVALSDGVYMQIVDRGSAENKTDTFANNNEICVRYIEEDIMTRDTTCFNVFLEELGRCKSALHESCCIPLCSRRQLCVRYFHTNGLLLGKLLSINSSTCRLAACTTFCAQLCPCTFDRSFQGRTFISTTIRQSILL